MGLVTKPLWARDPGSVGDPEQGTSADEGPDSDLAARESELEQRERRLRAREESAHQRELRLQEPAGRW